MHAPQNTLSEKQAEDGPPPSVNTICLQAKDISLGQGMLHWQVYFKRTISFQKE